MIDLSRLFGLRFEEIKDIDYLKNGKKICNRFISVDLKSHLLPLSEISSTEKDFLRRKYERHYVVNSIQYVPVIEYLHFDEIELNLKIEQAKQKYRTRVIEIDSTELSTIPRSLFDAYQMRFSKLHPILREKFDGVAVRNFCLVEKEQIIAAAFVQEKNSSWYYFGPVRDTNRSKISPGIILLREIIAMGFYEKKTQFNFGPGLESYKLQFATHFYLLGNYIIARNTALKIYLRLVLSIIRFMRRQKNIFAKSKPDERTLWGL